MDKGSTKRGGAAKKPARIESQKLVPAETLSYEQLEQLAMIIGGNGDEGAKKTDAFILLMDEIERAQHDQIRISLIAWACARAAFGKSDHADGARMAMVKKLRIKAGVVAEPL